MNGFYPKYSINPMMQAGMKKNWMAYPMAVITRLPASSVLLLIQNQRGGTVSAQPTMPTMSPITADTPPRMSASGSGSSSK